jgi:electron transport complex protein RnfG
MKETLRLVFALTFVCVIAALSLSVADRLTLENRERQDLLAESVAINAVLPKKGSRFLHDNEPVNEVMLCNMVTGEIQHFVQPPKAEKKRITDTFKDPRYLIIYVARKDEEAIGFAVKTKSDDGYSGRIVVMTGIDPDGFVNGVDIVRHSETPGLGALIDDPEAELDNPFKRQFSRRFRVAMGEEPISLATARLVDGKLAVRKDGGDIDAITGATISPRAVCQAVSDALRFYNERRDFILAKLEGKKMEVGGS